MTANNSPESGAAPLTPNRVTSEPPAPVDQQNLQQYVHLVWRIYQRSRFNAIDRKSRDR